MSEHPHAGRIAAVAHLSAALALADCAIEALGEDGIYSPEEAINDVRHGLFRAADEIMEPCEVADVLQTVEERIEARGPAPVDHALREHIVRSIVDARQAAKEDETPSSDEELACGDEELACDVCRGLPADRALSPDDECSCDHEPTDDELANRHGVEGGIGYRTEPSMEELLREKGDL